VFVEMVDPTAVEKFRNCVTAVDTLRVDTVSVDATNVLTEIVEPISVE